MYEIIVCNIFIIVILMLKNDFNGFFIEYFLLIKGYSSFKYF